MKKETHKIFTLKTLKPINGWIKEVCVEADDPFEAMSRVATLHNFFNFYEVPSRLNVKDLESFKDDLVKYNCLFLPKNMSLQKDN